MKEIEFPNTGKTFSGYHAAVEFVKARGYSYGSMQNDASIGLLKGDFRISKWRNLNATEIGALDGTIAFRGGPLDGTAIVRLKEPMRGEP